MNHEALEKANVYTKAHQKKRRWQKVVTALAAIVVFCTTYALILPAITMEASTDVGIAECTPMVEAVPFLDYVTAQQGEFSITIFKDGEALQPGEDGAYAVTAGETYQLRVAGLHLQTLEPGQYDIAFPAGVDLTQTGKLTLKDELSQARDAGVWSFVQQESGAVRMRLDVDETVAGCANVDLTADVAWTPEPADEPVVFTETVKAHVQKPEAQQPAALQEATVHAALYTDETYQQPLVEPVEITVSGLLPANAVVKAYPVEVSMPEQAVLCAYDITVFDENGVLYEPAADAPLTVGIRLTDTALEQNSAEPEVYYVPETGAAEPMEGTVKDDTIVFEASHFSVYAVAAANDAGVAPGNYGSRTYQISSQKNAFTEDPAYANYYNANSPLGVAGNFHVVAFGTAELRAHTNGNVLANTLKASSNFGTNNFENELSYVQNYEQVNNNSASKENHLLVIGSGNTVTEADNGNALAVNGVKQDKPHHIVQDVDTATTPFIDLNQVETEIRGVSQKLAAMEPGGITMSFSDQNNRELILQDPNSVGVCTLTVQQLQEFQNNPLRLKGFEKDGNGTIVINVDCAGATEINLPQKACIFINGEEQSTNEVTVFTAGKVIWNFTNAEGVKINTQTMTGMVIAPGATVEIKSNLNGTVVAENVIVSAESHRTDFTGQIVPSPEPETGKASLVLEKIDKENISIDLPDAEFDLYKWNSDQNDYELVGQYTSNANGQVAFIDLDYNTAYRLQETTAPTGYILGEKPVDFYMPHEDQTTYPMKLPKDFAGATNLSGAVMYVRNQKELESFELPKTGGAGITLYTTGGLLTLSVFLLLYKNRKRRKEEMENS